MIYCLRNSFDSYSAAPELISILFIFIIHKWKHNLLLSVGSGTVLYMLLVQNIFVF
ncbi:MAG: AzlD domain-containing protein [Erysipelotrichaceae bacterium]